MTKQAISITRALVELKKLDDRIARAIQSGQFVSRTVGRDTNRKVVGTNDSIEAVTARIQGSYDRVKDLIAYRAALKSAIVMSNAVTKVTVLGQEVTVAEAIEMKSTAAFRQTYLNTLRTQLGTHRDQVDRANNQLDVEIETSINTLYGADRTKIDTDTVRSVTDIKKSQKEQVLLDPASIEKKIAEVETEILNLTAELNFTLSESNARTLIEVEVV